MPTDEQTSPVAPELMAILRCPRCRGELDAATDAGHHELTCPRCVLGFRVTDGVPNFLLEDARPLRDAKR